MASSLLKIAFCTGADFWHTMAQPVDYEQHHELALEIARQGAVLLKNEEKAAYDSVFGRVESGWKIEHGHTVFEICIPANCTAELCLPGRKPETLGAGVYRRMV